MDQCSTSLAGFCVPLSVTTFPASQTSSSTVQRGPLQIASTVLLPRGNRLPKQDPCTCPNPATPLQQEAQMLPKVLRKKSQPEFHSCKNVLSGASRRSTLGGMNTHVHHGQEQDISQQPCL